MFTLKEARIIKALVEEERSSAVSDADSSVISLVNQYKCTLSGIAGKLDSLQSSHTSDLETGRINTPLY